MNQKHSGEPVTSGQSYKNKAALLLSNTSSACKRDIALLKQLFEVEEGPGFAHCAVSARLLSPGHMADA